MFKFKFLGNTHVPHRKNTAEMPAVRVATPKEVLLPLEQHIGAPATAIVAVGDEVKVGQLIAEASGFVSSPVYSSVSGKVTKLDSYLRSNGKTVSAIRIESDGLMTPYEGLSAPEINDLDSFISAMRNSGLVGLGGAGFPTAVKFEALKKGGIDTLILNGAECEPYITIDARTMIDDADLIAEGIALIKKVAPEIKSYIIGIEANKPSCIKKMKETFKDDASVCVKTLPSLYPQGAEKVLIRNTTGRTVLEGKLPADVGVIVINVTSLSTFAKYVKTGMPLVEKTLTLDGSAMKEPKNVILPIGTSIREAVELSGGFSEDPSKVILGGPMTGPAVCSLDEPILKSSGAIIALSKRDAQRGKETACIHCGRCTEACPHLLNTCMFEKAMHAESADEKAAMLEASRVNLCVECGCCTFVCPANRPLMENIRIAKGFLREHNAHKATLK